MVTGMASYVTPHHMVKQMRRIGVAEERDRREYGNVNSTSTWWFSWVTWGRVTGGEETAASPEHHVASNTRHACRRHHDHARYANSHGRTNQQRKKLQHIEWRQQLKQAREMVACQRFGGGGSPPSPRMLNRHGTVRHLVYMKAAGK